MSPGYLQRLFDRASPPPVQGQSPAPLAQPSGFSFSPIAEADQRLNDPAFAASFGFFAGGIGGGDAEVEPGIASFPTAPQTVRQTGWPSPPMASAPARRSSLATPDRPTAEPRMPTDEVAPGPADRGPAQPSAAAPIGDFDPPMLGQISSDDLVLPEPDEWPAEAAVPPPPQDAGGVPATDTGEPTARAIETTSPAHTNPPPAPQAPPVRQEVASTAEAAPAPAQPTRQSEPGRQATPPPVPSVKDEAVPAVEVPTPEPAAITEVAPATIRPPPLPEPPPRATDAPAPERPGPLAPIPREREVSTEPVPAGPPLPTRPMTAAEASIIGPLPPRQRVRTLFGLRRR